ncbi:hypothetical protein [Mucilaginibacter agri]|uniref:Uncharacterized protein n=1 Tax=Mucilaginibacter agri TaxID=2695265 RepID=A0A966DRW6_9SPHI|nr:hypothetical protein [Mucilaginibacter agri]NCD69518.1 hypothetical protein [Mucilaginibacter agri]
MQESSNEVRDNELLSLSNLAGLAAASVTITFTFAVVKLFIFYQLFLHVPIFQYTDVIDVIAMAPTAVFWAIFMGSIEAGMFVFESNKLIKAEKYLYGLMAYGLAIFITVIAYRNDPGIRLALIIPIRYWYYFVVPFVIYVVTVMYIQENTTQAGGNFMVKNKVIAVVIFTIWYAIFDSFANYTALNTPQTHLDYRLKFKNGQQLRTVKNIYFVGRSKGFWFIYNSSTESVRVINNEDVELVDINTNLSSYVDKASEIQKVTHPKKL